MDGIDTNASASSLGQVRPAATTSVGRTTAVAADVPAKTAAQLETANLISLLANAAPPIDSKKIEAIRSLIAQGRYPIDERAIATKMIALDVASPAAA